MNTIILILIVIILIVQYYNYKNIKKEFDAIDDLIIDINDNNHMKNYYQLYDLIIKKNNDAADWHNSFIEDLKTYYEAIRAKQDSIANSLGNFITISKENHKYIKSQFQIAAENAVTIGNGTKDNIEELKNLLINKDNTELNLELSDEEIDKIANAVYTKIQFEKTSKSKTKKVKE